MRLTIRYWFGLEGWFVFGTGTPRPVCHSSKSHSPFQKLLMKLNTSDRFSLFIALNASAGISLAPGDLLFFSPFSALVNSFQVIGSSNECSVSLWWICSSALGATGLALLKSFSQCGWRTLMFCLSVVAFWPFGSVSAIIFGLW